MFVLFLLSLSFLTLITTATSIAVLVAAWKKEEMFYETKHHSVSLDPTPGWQKQSDILWKVIQRVPLSSGFGLFTGLCAWSLLSLLYYHIQIISIGQTTNERVRGVYRRGDNPYDRGCARNWSRCAGLLCHPPPSRLPRDFSEVVTEGDDIVDSVWTARGAALSGSDSQTSLLSMSG